VANGSDGPLPRRKPSFEKRQVGSIRQRFADLVSLASGSFGTTPGDLMMVNLKSPDFSPLSEFLAGTGIVQLPGPIARADAEVV